MKGKGSRKLITAVLVLAFGGLAAGEIWTRIGLSQEFRTEAEEGLRREWHGPSSIGEVSASALSGGVVTFRDVVLGSPIVPDKAMVRLDTVRINGEIAEFVRGRLVVEDLLIDGGVIDVERLDDTSLAAVPSVLRRALPQPRTVGTAAWADVFSRDDILIRRLRIRDLRLRLTDHHTKQVPATVDIFPLNAGAADVVYPYETEAPAAQWWLKAVIETAVPGRIEASGEAQLFKDRPSFSAVFEVADLEAAKVGEFVPDDLDIQVFGGRLGFAGHVACDRGDLDGEWLIRAAELDAIVSEVLFGWDSQVSRLLIEYLGRDFQLERIPLDCGDIYDPAFEFPECVYEQIKARVDETYGPAIERMRQQWKKASDIFGGLLD